MTPGYVAADLVALAREAGQDAIESLSSSEVSGWAKWTQLNSDNIDHLHIKLDNFKSALKRIVPRYLNRVLIFIIRTVNYFLLSVQSVKDSLLFQMLHGPILVPWKASVNNYRWQF